MEIFLGLIAGFIGSIPVAGPISILIFKNSLEGNWRFGRGIAVGASLAEAAYALLAFWGFSTFFAQYEYILPVSKGIGSAILLGLGVHFLRFKDLEVGKVRKKKRKKARSGFFTGFSIAALNPTLLVTWSAAITTIFSSEIISFEGASGIRFAIGVGLGISGWFTLLMILIARYRRKLKPLLQKLVRSMGVLLLLLGIVTLYQLVKILIS